jgi:hypothetical protein
MEEIGPIVAGVLLAWLASFIAQLHWRGAVVAVLALAAGFAWSHFVGELARHPAYGLLDAAQVLLACVVVRWLASRLVAHRSQRSNG